MTEATPPAGTLAGLAATARAIAATSSRNEKADTLGAFLQGLDDADCARAARLIAGRAFPLSDQRTVNVGFAALLDAVGAVTGQSREALQPRLVALGDPGDVAAEALQGQPPSSPPFSLAETQAFLEDLASTRGTKKKTAAVAEVLKRLGPDEAWLLVGLLAGDMRIGMKAGGVEGAIARLHGLKTKAVQRAGMFTGDLGETALLARHDRLETAVLRPFHPLGFMLASPGEDAADIVRQLAGGFAVEDKFDGIRAQAHVASEASLKTEAPEPGVEHPDLHGRVVDGTRVALFSRTLDEIGRAFPDLVDVLAELPVEGAWILDGEIVPVQGAAVQPFQTLQKRLGRKTVTDELAAQIPVAFIVYDVLAADGASLLDAPFRSRQAALDRLGLPPATADAPLRRSRVESLKTAEELDAAFDAARARGNEGLMVKAWDSVYTPGRRGKDWLKLKKALGTLDVVVTSVERGHGKRRKLLSDVTFAVRASEADDTLLNVGKAYSGLTDVELAELTAHFEQHTLQTYGHGKVHVVEPNVVLEVAFDNVQVSKRHKSGYALRFPRIVRRRTEKPVAEIDTLDTVRALAGE